MVTLGVCVRNSERTVRGAIESIIAQKYPRECMETIIVDGESTDNTIQIVKNLASKTDIRMALRSDGGMGLGHARQMVTDNASGKYIIFVDGDVELLNDFVEKQVDFMEEFPRVGIAVGRYMYRRGTLVAELQNLYSSITEFVGSDATIYRVEALNQIGGFDNNIKGAFEDLDVMARLRSNGWMVCTNTNAEFYHNPRQNLIELLAEQEWSGYGGHYFRHKHRNSLTPFTLLHRFPVIAFFGTLKVALKAYGSLHQKKVFLMPFLFSLRAIPWWVGFVRGHIDGYGHQLQM